MQKVDVLNALKTLIVLLPGILICIFNLGQYPAYFWDEMTYFRQAGTILAGNGYDIFYSLSYPNLSVFLFAIFRLFSPTLYFIRYVPGIFSILTGLLVYKTVKLYISRAWAIFAAYLYYFSNVTLVFDRMAMLDPGLSLFSLLTLYLIQIYRRSYKEKVKAINANPDDGIQIKNELHDINTKYLILISLSSICAVFSKITGLFLFLYFILIILFLPLVNANRGEHVGDAISSKKQNPVRKTYDFIIKRIKQNPLIFRCFIITGVAIALYLSTRFVYFYLNPPPWYTANPNATTYDIADFSLDLGQFNRSNFLSTNTFVMDLFSLDPALCIGVIGVIYYGLKRQHNTLTIMNFSIIIVMYFSLTAFNYHYIADIIPFLIIVAVLLIHEKNVLIILFIILNLFTINGYAIDGFFSAFPEYKLYSLALIIALIYMLIVKPVMTKTRTAHHWKVLSRIPSFSKENVLFWMLALIILPSAIGTYLNIAHASENAGFYDVVTEINAHTNTSDYVFTSYLFPLGYELKAQQLNILNTYDNKTNMYNITMLKYVIFDQFWVYYSNSAQNLTRLNDAVIQIQNNWTRIMTFGVRWTNAALSPFAPMVPLIPEINPSVLVLYRNPSIKN
ncbi:MAG TPA: phospholipid carrier-dependent glycosyltransferase [Candidatus Lokiarchaeia archaeon]|nr:phospholipid carrier-dependent glycosyltransferase [Candidatus Lokiarchaeia archaeon]